MCLHQHRRCELWLHGATGRQRVNGAHTPSSSRHAWQHLECRNELQGQHRPAEPAGQARAAGVYAADEQRCPGRQRACSSGSPPLSVMPPLWSPWLRYGCTRSSFLASSLLLVSLPAQPVCRVGVEKDRCRTASVWGIQPPVRPERVRSARAAACYREAC